MTKGGDVSASVGTSVLGMEPIKGGRRRKTGKQSKTAKKDLVRHTRKVKKAYQRFVKLANKKVGGSLFDFKKLAKNNIAERRLQREAAKKPEEEEEETLEEPEEEEETPEERSAREEAAGKFKYGKMWNVCKNNPDAPICKTRN